MKLTNTIYAPQETVNDDYLSLVNIYVNTGDLVQKDSLLAEIETSKALIEVRSDYDGYVVVHVEPNTDVKVGSTMILEIFDSPITNTLSTGLTSENDSGVTLVNSNLETYHDVKFSKSALDYIAKNNIDVKKFSGLAFVTTNDCIKTDAGNNSVQGTNKTQSVPNKNTGIVKETNQSEKIIKPLAAGKKREFEYLSSVNSSSVISRLSTYVQVTSKESVGLTQNFITSTPLPTIIHEVSTLLIKYPNLNSFYLNDNQAFYNDINIGFAVDDGKNGLKVATIFNANQLSLKSIEETIADLSLKYTNQQLTVVELTSATFTITDLYDTNIVSFHPLVNINNSAIMGISGFKNGEFIIDLSFDHRLTSGKEVALFLADLKFRLEARFSNEGRQASEATANDLHCAKCLRGINDDMNGQIFFQKAVNSKYNGYICSNCLNAW